ncbi:uncharacterized protein LOC121378447 [Gigantopelta aegis]|uniref:uncharacterized protein LOC121378447 n=1 Tax=Gigantopelta aegis TaxID=1735272 RepID=UPI001B8875DF|nr:uncharacterized protein LOC121378447 [Gigantopelta aegis]
MLIPHKSHTQISKPRRHIIDYQDDVNDSLCNQSPAKKWKPISLENVQDKEIHKQRSERTRHVLETCSSTHRRAETMKLQPISWENVSQETNKQRSERSKFILEFSSSKNKLFDTKRLHQRYWEDSFKETNKHDFSKRTSSKGKYFDTNKLKLACEDVNQESNRTLSERISSFRGTLSGINKLKFASHEDGFQESNQATPKGANYVQSGKETLTLGQFMKERLNIGDPSKLQKKLPWSLNLDINSQPRSKRKRIIHKAKVIASHHSVEKNKMKNDENNSVDSPMSDLSLPDSPKSVEEIKLEDFTKDKILLELQLVQECLKKCSVVEKPMGDTELASMHDSYMTPCHIQPMVKNSLYQSRISNPLSNSVQLNTMPTATSVFNRDHMFQNVDQMTYNLYHEIHQTSANPFGGFQSVDRMNTEQNLQNLMYNSSTGSYSNNTKYSENVSEDSVVGSNVKEREALTEVEHDLLEALRSQVYIGRSHQKVPNDILFPSETTKLYTEEGCFLLLLVPISRKPYQRLLNMKISLQKMFKEKFLCVSQNNTARVMELNKEIKRVQNQRKTLLTTFTGSLGKKRLRRLNLTKNRYDLCIKFLVRQYGRECLDRLLYVQTLNKAIRSHVKIVERELACPSL